MQVETTSCSPPLSFSSTFLDNALAFAVCEMAGLKTALILSFIMLKNGQAYFKNLVLWTPQDL